MSRINLNHINKYDEDSCIVCEGTEFKWSEKTQGYSECIQCGTISFQVKKKFTEEKKQKIRKFKKNEQ
jgi:hypothetical protein